MENFLTIAPLSRPECEALLAAAAQKLCGVLALPPEYQGGAAAFAKSLAHRIMASLP